jgi:hypothetical protein
VVTPPFSGEHKRPDLHAVVDRANSHAAVHRHSSERGASLLISGRYRFTIPDRKCDAIVQQCACFSSRASALRSFAGLGAQPADAAVSQRTTMRTVGFGEGGMVGRDLRV